MNRYCSNYIGIQLFSLDQPLQSIPQITIHLLYIVTLQHVDCGIMYIQQNTPQITIHLLYIDTIQQVDCDIMYIPQNTPQITIHLLYIDTLQQVDCNLMHNNKLLI